MRVLPADDRPPHACKVDMLQLHGTGTPLGDPIEVNAALAVLCAAPRPQSLTVTAAKASTGHAEAAAGIVGVLAGAVSMTSRAGLANLQLRWEAVIQVSLIDCYLFQKDTLP